MNLDKACHRRSSSVSPVVLGGLVAVAVFAGLFVSVTGSPPSAMADPPSIQIPSEMTPEFVNSIDRGLTYLANTQRDDGSWVVGGGYRQYSVVFTSIAGLSFLASGSTPESGPYSRNVARAMNYVLSHADPETGLIATNSTSRSMYDHGFGMLFLAQCYGMELTEAKEKQLHKALTLGVGLIARSQSDLGSGLGHAGGWYYTPEARSDEGSVTVTQLQALRACRNVGIAVPKDTIDRAVGYLKHCQMADGGICYSASSATYSGGSRPPISAAALTCFYASGYYDRQAGGVGDEARMVERLWAYCDPLIVVSVDQGDTWGHYYYGHLYYGQAMYMRGGRQWDEYYAKFAASLVRSQNLDGSWSGGTGTAYRTAIATLIMQLPYGYLPICQR